MEKHKIFADKYYVTLLSVFCCILWGSAFPVLKIGFKELNLNGDDIYSKMLFAGLRFLIAGVLVCIFYILMYKDFPKIKKNDLSKLFVFGILGTTLQYFFFYNGLANTTGIKASVIASSGTFFTIILAHYWYKDDKMNFRKILGLILGFIGIIIVNWSKNDSTVNLFDFKFVGEGFLLLTGLASALSTLYGKKISSQMNPVIANCYQLCLGSIVLILIGLIGGKGFFLVFTLKAFILLIYSAFLSAISFTLWYTMLKYNKASEVAIYKFLVPVFGSILSVIFIGEIFTIQVIEGMVLASLGIYLVNKKKVDNN